MTPPSPHPIEREIARLQALVAGAARRRERAQERQAHADRLTIQVQRVEQALARITARLDRLAEPSTRDDHEAREELRTQERNLHAKIGTLSSARNAVLATPSAASRGAHEHLHACLLLHLDALRCDPTTHPARVERTRRQLVELVRSRRQHIDELANALEASRDATIALVHAAAAADPSLSPRALDVAVLALLDASEAHFARARHQQLALVDEWPSLGRALDTRLWSSGIHADLRLLLVSDGASAMRQGGRLESDVMVPARRLAIRLDELAGISRALPPPGTDAG